MRNDDVRPFLVQISRPIVTCQSPLKIDTTHINSVHCRTCFAVTGFSISEMGFFIISISLVLVMVKGKPPGSVCGPVDVCFMWVRMWLDVK